jgi:hypothetical protein
MATRRVGLRLKAGSHPIGGRRMLVTSGEEVAEVALGDGGSRSPLLVRQNLKRHRVVKLG